MFMKKVKVEKEGESLIINVRITFLNKSWSIELLERRHRLYLFLYSGFHQGNYQGCYSGKYENHLEAKPVSLSERDYE